VRVLARGGVHALTRGVGWRLPGGALTAVLCCASTCAQAVGDLHHGQRLLHALVRGVAGLVHTPAAQPDTPRRVRRTSRVPACQV
jgi:hypothetical protein